MTRVWLVRLWVLVALCTALPVRAAPEFRFRQPAHSSPLLLGPAILSDEDRQFIASLPEVRVALQQVGAPPYETVAADGEITGFQAELLGHLARALGLRLRPMVYPAWPQVLGAVRDGQADMVLTLAITPDRLQYLNFTLGTVQVPTGLMAVRGQRLAPNGARFAIEREYYTAHVVRRLYPAATTVAVADNREALQAVAQGKADFYLGDLLGALDTLAHDPMPGVELREIVQTGSDHYHFGVRKDWPRLVELLNKGIARFRSDSGPRGLGPGVSATRSGVELPTSLTLTPAEAALLAHRSVWRIGAVRGLAMLNDIDVSGAHSGISAEYAEHVARRLGVGMDIVPYASVADMLDGLRAGRIDFIPFLTRTPAREREFSFSKPYFEMPYVLVARTDAPLYWDLGSLRGKRLALPPQHALRDLLSWRYPEIQVVDAQPGTNAMDLVARGEADAAIETKIFANLRINADAGSRLRVVAEVSELPAQFAFATQGDMIGMLPLLNRALDEVSPAESERMLRRWVAVDLEPVYPWRRHLPELLTAAAALLLTAGGTVWWTRRLAGEVRARRRADEQLDDIGRTMPGVAFRYVLNADGSIKRTFFSSGVTAFLGFQPPAGQMLHNALGPRTDAVYIDAARRLAADSLRTGEPFKATYPYRHPDGRAMWLRTEAVCSRNGEGDPVWTGYVVDISAERALQERLQQEAAERHVLLASASHELRAPTHTLSLALQAIPADGVPPASARSLRIARDAARTLGQLLDDVLDAARFQAQAEALELRPQDFDLHGLLEQVCDAHAGPAAAKGLAYACEVAPDVPRMAYADPLRIKQVLTNLLSNAVKYTEQGRVSLGVALGVAPADGSGAGSGPGSAATPTSTLEFTIDDTGPGIAMALRAGLFEPFGAAPVERGSSGLGLSICRRLAALMGGSIQLESRPGGGTRARFSLPGAWRSRPGLPLRREGCVLVCDDDPVCRILLAEALRRSGYAVVEVEDGRAALQRWQAGGVRLLITDLTMGGLSGGELVAAIRQAEADQPGQTERTAIIVCSGDLTPVSAVTDAAPRHDGFLSKPLDLGTLRDLLEALGLHADGPVTP